MKRKKCTDEKMRIRRKAILRRFAFTINCDTKKCGRRNIIVGFGPVHSLSMFFPHYRLVAHDLLRTRAAIAPTLLSQVGTPRDMLGSMPEIRIFGSSVQHANRRLPQFGVGKHTARSTQLKRKLNQNQILQMQTHMKRRSEKWTRQMLR